MLNFFKRDALSKKQGELKKHVNKSIKSLSKMDKVVQDLNDTNTAISSATKEITDIKQRFDVVQGELVKRQEANQELIDKLRA